MVAGSVLNSHSEGKHLKKYINLGPVNAGRQQPVQQPSAYVSNPNRNNSGNKKCVNIMCISLRICVRIHKGYDNGR